MKYLIVFKKSSHTIAMIEGVLVTVIWASSFVLGKMGLEYLAPLTMAGLRYFLGALFLLPFALRNHQAIRLLTWQMWVRLFLIGLSAYTVGNGALFLGLKYLPATTVSFLLNFTPLLILFASILWLREKPSWLQSSGVGLTLVGSAIFFSPGMGATEWLGVGILVIGLLGFTVFAILGRKMARDRDTDTLTLTIIPLALGGALLLIFALPAEGLPKFSLQAGGIMLWLSIVNTAFAYLLYNHAIKVLTALEMNTLLNLSPFGTACLAWLLLGDSLNLVELAGILVVVLGVTLVQWKRSYD